ncbi:YcgL domain-containing protein [Alkalilimnicola sp. S0819]|uniref:YcgL domain-containing protein n=1 Tax=Alkalilimnicola sp. S0819 TaxID=2613922 RepID=UPI00126268A2|nr:YcgL domain-containing protein [Alkalilimnicola sp. S0819]KAB7624382.1 YcgL domain-containing protein [Alkalilimnicola sp. S0819]MPQ16209.1 hypothetical protein [Alkalilimnicola sp. S0819]
MHCSIYKGHKKPDTYLYVPVKDDLSTVPAPIMGALGATEHVMDLVLTPARRLAREDVCEVMRSLLHRGCFVQLPPGEDELSRGN